MKQPIKGIVRCWTAFILSFCMVIPSSGLTAAAEEQVFSDGLCPHHPKHTAECGYAEETEEQPCTHMHDASCGYQENAEEDSCTHEHDASCGYAEASAQKACTYICEECSLTAGNTTIQAEKTAPETKIQPEEGKNESSILKSDGTDEPVPAVRAGDIGDVLNGDYAYISDAGIRKDQTTDSGYAVRTGTAPWDENTGNGNDSSDLNNTVRSFDSITYTVYFESKVRDGAPYKAYRTGTLHFEFILPASAEQAQFDIGSMGWLDSKHGEYTITDSTYNGKACQVLRGTCLLEPGDGNPSVIGESYQTLNLAIRTLAVKEGDTIRPEFTFWLDHNEVPSTGLVTGSGHRCTAHGETEYKTISSPEITVTSAPRYNVQIRTGFTSTQYLNTFDFSTGNDKAQNKDAGTRYGRVQAFGVTLQIEGKSAQHGLRGCELPDGSDITFDLKLSSSYRRSDGTSQDVSDVYTPLLWSAEGNSEAGTQQDGRLISVNDRYAFLAAPFNRGGDYRSCKEGGTWTGIQNGKTIQVTVSGYDIDLTKLPYTDAKNDTNVYTYYNPNTSNGYWDIQTACFSAGEFWIMQPFYDADGNYIADEYGNGNFIMTVEDGGLEVTGESGQQLPETEDNSNQIIQTDDRQSVTMALEQPGEIEQYIGYQGTEVTDAYWNEGKDWSLSGGGINIQENIAHLGAEGMNTAVAYDDLIKFDDSFFDIETAAFGLKNGVENLNCRLLYGAKPDKNGWDHGGKDPGESGYDKEMMQATADDLIFFSSLQELKEQDYICVGVLMEARGLASTQSTEIYFTAQGSVKDTARSGSVYMVTHSAKAWNKKDVQQAAAEYLKKNTADLTDEDYKTYAQSSAFTSRADQMTAPEYKDYPDSFWTNNYDTREGLATYLKSQYDESGYINGTAGRNYGDSCLVVDYATQIEKKRAQTSVGSDGKPYEKQVYDLDSGQITADYILTPSAIRTAGDFSSEDELTTTVYVEDILPEGLTYIPFSSYWGGTYTQTAEGKQGSVTDGVLLEPEVIDNDDGSTTLRWTLENVTITAETVTEISPIYYSCDIGSAGNVENNDELLNEVKIWSDGEQKKDFNEINGNLADISIRVVKNFAVSLSKLSDQTEVEAGEDMGFTMNIGNNAGNSLAVIAMDSLPYNSDEAGSIFTGACVVSEFSIISLKEEFDGTNFRLYYTEDENERGKSSRNYTVEDFSGSDSVWTELSVDTASGIADIPDEQFRPVAIAAVGSLPANQTLKMHVSIQLPEGQPGERVVNRLTCDGLESHGRSYIVGRTLEGVVWLDENKNGLREEGESLQKGATVTLMKLKDGGNASELDDYEPYQAAGKEAAVSTSEQMNVITGTVSAHSEGRYRFTNLPEGIFGVRFSDGTFKMADYEASPVNQGTDDTIDSDAVPFYDAGNLTQAFISGLIMPAREDIDGIVYNSRDNDLGLFPAEKPEPVNISVEKVWKDADNQDGKRPESVQVQLYADNTASGDPVKLNAGNDWHYTWSGLEAEKDGKDIVYTVKEVGENNGRIEFNGVDYVVIYGGSEEEGYIITNSYTPGKTSVSVRKDWDDGNNQDGIRPKEIVVKLLADKEDTGKTVKLNSGNNWSGSFTELDEYKDGVKILYTIEEVSVEGYKTEITGDASEGFTVTNRHEPETVDISGSKTWDDGNNQDGKRPGSITIRLYADGTELEEKAVNVTEEDGWKWEFKDLPKYKEGKEITYTITEDAVADYTTEITGDASEGFMVTNRYTPGKTSVSVTKAWDDKNNQDGIRPKEIVVKLLADKEDTGKTVKLNSGNNWSGSFTELDEYKDGVKILYTIEEVSVEGYKTEITGDMEKGFVITNHHTPASQEIPKGTDETENPPQTGDYSTSGFWATSWIISFISIVGIYLFKRKKKMK